MGLASPSSADLSSDTHADAHVHFSMSLNVSASSPSQSETQKRDGVPAAGERRPVTPHSISGGRAHLHVSVHAST